MTTHELAGILLGLPNVKALLYDDARSDKWTTRTKPVTSVDSSSDWAIIAGCADSEKCDTCARDMDRGEPHTAECASALAQDGGA